MGSFGDTEVLQLASAILAVAVVASACSATPPVGQRSPDQPRATLESHDHDADPLDDADAVSSEDVAAADTFFAGFTVSGQQILPESTRANELVAECLERFGFPVIYAGAGGVLAADVPEQRARQESLVDLCMGAMERRGLISLDDGDRGVRRIRYEAYLEAHACLTDLGLTLESPPSLDAYLDGEPWSLPPRRAPSPCRAADTSSGRCPWRTR